MARKFGQKTVAKDNVGSVVGNIYKLGICGAPGQTFKIDDSTMYIGPTGIYELDLEGMGIYIKKVEIIEKAQQKTIIDYIYEDNIVATQLEGGDSL